MFTQKQRKQLQKANYKLVGKNIAVKLCHWCKTSIKTGEERICYKEKFYGIKSHRCLQMTPAMSACNLRCLHCWRNHDYFNLEKSEFDKPLEVVEKSIQAQRELLSGLGGIEHSEKQLSGGTFRFAIELDTKAEWTSFNSWVRGIRYGSRVPGVSKALSPSPNSNRKSSSGWLPFLLGWWIGKSE